MVGGLSLWKRAPRFRVAFLLGVYLVGYAVLWAYPDERGRLLLFLAGALLLEAKRAGLLDRPPGIAGQTGAAVFLMFAFYVYFGLNSSSMLWAGPRLLEISFSPFLITVPLFSVAFFWLGYQSFRPGGLLSRMLSFRPLRYLGNMSYTVYLFHVLALEAVRWLAMKTTPPSGNQPVLFLIWCIVGWLAVWLLSTVVFLVVEKPISLRKSATSPAPRSS